MPPLDLRHLPPPEPMQRILDALHRFRWWQVAQIKRRHGGGIQGSGYGGSAPARLH